MIDMQKLSILGWRFIGATTILSAVVAWVPAPVGLSVCRYFTK